MMSSATHPFSTLSRVVTAKLRSKVHSQTYQSTAMALQRSALTPAGRVTVNRVNELALLRERHQRTFDPAVRVEAQQLLRTLPILSVDEDPHFSVTLKSLRLAAYFDDNPATSSMSFSLLNHLTSHAFQLDGYNIYLLLRVLNSYRTPYAEEALRILIPRMRKVVAAEEVTGVEAALMVSALAQYKIDDAELLHLLAEVVAHTVADMSIAEITIVVQALPFIGVENAKEVLRAGERRICSVLVDGILQCQAYRASLQALSSGAASGAAAAGMNTSESEAAGQVARPMQLCQLLVPELVAGRKLVRALFVSCSLLCWAPRSVLAELCRASLTWSDPTTFSTGGAEEGRVGEYFPEEQAELASVQAALPTLTCRDLCHATCMLARTGYYHERVLRVLASRIAAASSLLHTKTVAAAASHLSFGASDELEGAEQGDGEGDGARPFLPPSMKVPQLDILRVLTTTVESLAFFRMRDVTQTVTAMLEEIVVFLPKVAPEDRCASAVLARLFLSLDRLGYVRLRMMASATAPSEAAACAALILGLCESEVVERYVSSAECVTNVLITSRLLLGTVCLSCDAGLVSFANGQKVQQSLALMHVLAELMIGVNRHHGERVSEETLFNIVKASRVLHEHDDALQGTQVAAALASMEAKYLPDTTATS